MTAPIKTNRIVNKKFQQIRKGTIPIYTLLPYCVILALRTPEVSSTLKETGDDVEFATDMEEPVCEGSEEHNHQQERHQHGITVIYFEFLRIIIKETT